MSLRPTKIRPEHGLAIIRIGLGLEFLLWGWTKVEAGWLENGQALSKILSDELSRSEPVYRLFLEGVALPNAALFAKLVTMGELAAGITLSLGLMTHWGALTGMWLMANFMLMRGAVGVEASIDRLFLLCCGVCLLTGAGCVWGLDGEPQAVSGRRSGANPWLEDARRMSHGVGEHRGLARAPSLTRRG